MAQELWQEVGPLLAAAPGHRLHLAGHSLGGSLSLLLAVMAQVTARAVPGGK